MEDWAPLTMSPAVLSYSAAGQLDQCSFSYSCNGVAWISFKVVILKFINYFILFLKKTKTKPLCTVINLVTICIQGEDTELRLEGCWFGLAHSVSQCRIMLLSPQPFLRGGISRTALQSHHIRRFSALFHLTFLSYDLAPPSSSAPGA